MAIELRQITWRCPVCRRSTVHSSQVRVVNHVTYALITIFLCGLALPIWIIATLRAGPIHPWRCVECGHYHRW